jgi:hypothetical protein
MDQLLKDQHKVAGTEPMNASQMESTVGAVLSFLKSQGVNVDSVNKTIPNASTLMANAETSHHAKSADHPNAAKAAVGGVIDKIGSVFHAASPAVKGNTTTTPTTTTAVPAPVAASGAKPVDSMPALLKNLSSAGVSPQQINTALPLVASTLQSKCGVDAYATLGLEHPAAGATAASSGGKHSGGGTGGVLGGLRGFLTDVKTEVTGKK